MKDKQTIAQFLKVKDFPFKIKDKNGEVIYYEDSYGYWQKYEYNDKGNVTYSEVSNGYWCKCEYDDKGNEIYIENSDGFWSKREYNDKDGLIYFENSSGSIVDRRPKPMIELTLEDIAKLKGVDVSQIRIKE
jgi:hypothetical protein